MQLQPLPREFLHEAVELRIALHPRELLGEHGPFVQFPAAGGGGELLVGQRAPEEVGEPAGQLVVGDAVAAIGRRSLLEKIEILGGEDGGHGRKIRFPRLLARRPLGRRKSHIRLHLGLNHRPSPGLLGEAVQAVADLLLVVERGGIEVLPH